MLSVLGELPAWTSNPSLQQVELTLLFPAVAQKVVALRKKQQLAIGPCKSLPNSPSHSAVSAASIPAVHINQVRLPPCTSWFVCLVLPLGGVISPLLISPNSQLFVASFLLPVWLASVWPFPAPCPGFCPLHSTVFPLHYSS